MAGRRRSGDAILIRHVHFGRVFHALPVRVVRDDDELCAWWIAPGTPCIYPDATDEAGALLPRSGWSTRTHTWFGNGNLDLARPGERRSVRLFWNGDGSFRGWYVNLQEPIRRMPHGFDFRDLALDLLVAPDLTWQLKDEDHLEQGAAMGIFSGEELRAVHEERDGVLERLDELFPTGWEAFRPDPGWTTLALPAEWARVE